MARNAVVCRLLAGLASFGTLAAQISYDSQETVYSQNFDTLPSTGSTFTWTHNSTITGWYAATSVGTGFNSAGVTTGSTTSGGLYSFGSSASTDRALGSIGSGSAGNFYWGVKLVNNTSTTITGFTVTYTGEQWRNSAAAAQATTVSYSLSATDLKTGTYQTITTLGFTSPITGGTAGALNGNTSANRTVIGPITVNNINWAPGAALWIRFYDPDHTGTDHGLAIDDFSFQAASSQSSAYDPPAGYYNAATGLTGTTLQSALHNIISPHTVIPYTQTGGGDAWAALKVLDEDPSDSTKVKLTYSGTSILKTDTSWNCEHLWPQSRGVSGSGPDYSDLFDLRPILGTVNSARSNKIYDTSNTADTNYHMPATTGAAADTSTDSDSWQPSTNERGDIARSLFYMDVRYDGNDSGTVDLVLENQINTSADMAVLSTLVAWSAADPVSEDERKRNSTIYTTYQHNRNPFIDHPEYVQSIYGDFVRLSGDTDMDGMPNSWETTHTFSTSDPTDANGDADGDGFSNFEEYWMGTDPRNSADPVTLIVDKSYTGSVEDGSAAHPFKTIQGAADVVPVSEIRAILVKPGTYSERPYIHDKNSVFVFSEQGASQTIIDATGGSSSAVRMYDFQRAAFVGFTIRNATTSWYGAGLRVDAPNGSILLAENKITSNSSSATSNGGGGVYLKTANGSRVVNNFIVGNTAVRGGGVLFGGGNAEFWFNTIAGDTATGGNGGGLSALQGVHPDIRDNIIWGNTGGSSTAQIHQITGLTNNILQGAASGSGNVGSDPLFVGSGDYHLTASSPAKNAAVALPNGKDFDTDARPDTSGGQKDIGADEYVTVTNPDSDGNGLPDAWEQQYFHHLGVDPNGDDDGDSLANFLEYQQGSDPTDFFNGQAPVLAIVSGDNQAHLPGQTLTAPLTVKVTNQLGIPRANLAVSFAATSGGGTPHPINSGLSDSAGLAKANFDLPNTAGASSSITASITVAGHSAQVVFHTTVGDNSAAPQAPGKPTITEEHGATTALVEWEDRSNNEEGFYVERTADGTTWTRVATVATNKTSYTDTGLTSDLIYFYRIIAYNSAP